MAAQGQLEMVLSLAPWAVFDDGWYHLMIRAKMKTHWVSLKKGRQKKPLWYVEGGTGTLRGGG